MVERRPSVKWLPPPHAIFSSQRFDLDDTNQGTAAGTVDEIPEIIEGKIIKTDHRDRLSFFEPLSGY